MIAIDQFDYQLPTELIAQVPAQPRDSSRLLLLDRQTEGLSDHHFYDLPDILAQVGPVKPILVRNNTKVMPARLLGHKPTGGQVEILLLKSRQINPSAATETWEVLSKPGLKLGQVVKFGQTDLQAICTQVDQYQRLIEFNKTEPELLATLDQIGQMPLPPYIHWAEEDTTALRQLYQTTYAKHLGSAAAPTAGLHFTPELDRRLASLGIEIAEVTLHVGLATFQPVKDQQLNSGQLHREWFELSEATADLLNQAKAQGRPIIAVGTTTTRVLESAVDLQTGLLQPVSRETDIFIHPPYQFRFVDGLVTNFHQPKSSLLMMISAMATAPNTDQVFSDFNSSLVGKAYQHAIANHYRFHSFGDAMLIL
jgi:S-adenosylmethionine:tRNA ribosyltransferase-isomerase